MNKLAVALAADSIVTLRSYRGAKTYNSVNKLFKLSKYRPVGIMVYSNADLMGVPWELIIKLYRDRLGRKSFATLAEYQADFVKFLERHSTLFPETLTEQWIRRTLRDLFKAIKEEAETRVDKLVEEGKTVRKDEVTSLLQGLVSEIESSLSQASVLSNFKHLTDKVWGARYGALVKEVADQVFQTMAQSQPLQQGLRRIARWVVIRDFPNPSYSGIVIAGFGEAEHYPSLTSFVVESIVDGRLRCHSHRSHVISDGNEAAVVPFAQDDMVRVFMEGVDPSYEAFTVGYLSRLVARLPEAITAELGVAKGKEKEALQAKYKALFDGLRQDFETEKRQYRLEHHAFPIIRAVAALPKDELASLAESLVNLTSLKRRISLDLETVGGPIDVAVISKGDGFIWIKRKHYFDAGLNPHFIANYGLQQVTAVDDPGDRLDPPLASPKNRRRKPRASTSSAGRGSKGPQRQSNRSRKG